MYIQQIRLICRLNFSFAQFCAEHFLHLWLFYLYIFSIRVRNNRRVLELKEAQLDKKKHPNQDGDQLLTWIHYLIKKPIVYLTNTISYWLGLYIYAQIPPKKSSLILNKKVILLINQFSNVDMPFYINDWGIQKVKLFLSYNNKLYNE